MIEIYLKYDNMHIFGMINAFNCINKHVNSCINNMLSAPPSPSYLPFNLHLSVHKLSCVTLTFTKCKITSHQLDLTNEIDGYELITCI